MKSLLFTIFLHSFLIDKGSDLGSILLSPDGYALLYDGKGLQNCKDVDIYILYGTGLDKIKDTIIINHDTAYFVKLDRKNEIKNHFEDKGTVTDYYIYDQQHVSHFIDSYRLQHKPVELDSQINIVIDTIDVFHKKVYYDLDSSGFEIMQHFKIRIRTYYNNELIYQNSFDSNASFSNNSYVEVESFKLYSSETIDKILLIGRYFHQTFEYETILAHFLKNPVVLK